jgi:hypothetical protein
VRRPSKSPLLSAIAVAVAVVAIAGADLSVSARGNGILLRLAASFEPLPDASFVQPLSDAGGAESVSDTDSGHLTGAVPIALAVPVQLPAAAAAAAAATAAGGAGGATSAAAATASEADAVHDGYETRWVQHQVGGAARRVAEGFAPDRVGFFL